MLSILFKLGKEQYALDSENVVEITHIVSIKQVPEAPKHIKGLLNFRGTPVPVIDLCVLSMGTPCKQHMSTRIIIISVERDNKEPLLIGLLAENVTGVTRHEEESLVDSNLKLDKSDHLGPIHIDHDTNKVTQYINANALISEDILSLLGDSDYSENIQNVFG